MYYTTPCIKVQRVTMAAFGVRVDGTSSRGLWPPDGGRLCSLRSGGDSAYGAEGCGGGSAADLKKGARLAPQMVSKNFLLDKVKGPGI